MPASRLLWKPWDEINFQNPYPMYAELQAQDPVHRAQTGEWIITRYEDVKAILKDPRFRVGNRMEWLKRGITYLNNPDLDFQLIAEAMKSFMLFLNPPQHTRVRKFVSGVWANYQVDGMVERTISKLIRQLPERHVDLVKDFAQPLPALTMAEMLGIPQGDYSQLKVLSRELSKAMDLYISVEDLVTIHSASAEFIQYFRNILVTRMFSDEGLIFKICEANKSIHEPLSENELISVFIFLFTAGEETTASLIGSGILNLLRSNATRPENWDLAVDELLRFDPPVQLLGRIAGETIELHGKKIEKGSSTTLCLGGANRDPSIFPNPDLLDLTRQQNRHLAFGSGIHFCMGDWLGRLQGKMAIKKMMETYPKIKLGTETLSWNRNLAIRNLTSLPVIVN